MAGDHQWRAVAAGASTPLKHGRSLRPWKNEGGNENHAHFRENWGGRKIKRGRKSKLVKHIFALFSSYFLKNFLARSARSITFYFHPPIRGRGTYGRDGKVRLAFKSGTKMRRFSVPLLLTWCHQIDHIKSKLNIKLYIVHFLLHWSPIMSRTR